MQIFHFFLMAPKNKNDLAWVHCHLNEQGIKVCNFCGKKVKGGGIQRVKEHLVHWRGQVKPCENVSDDLKAEMLSFIEAYNEEKGRNKRLKKDISKIQKDDAMFSDPDFEEYMPSFEDSSSFPGKAREGSSSGLNLRRTVACNGIDFFFVPRTTPGSQPTLDAKWKKIEKGVAYECIARWWYDADIPFNATNFAYYQPMIDAIASCGPGFKGP